MRRSSLVVAAINTWSLLGAPARAQTAPATPAAPAASSAPAAPAPSSAPAARRRPPSPYRLRWDTDPALLVLSSATWGLTELALGQIVHPNCPCDANQLLPIDRPFAGRFDGGFALAADISVFTAIGAALVVDGVDALASHAPVDDYLEDAAVIAETVLISGAVNQMVKLGVQRPRPLTYGRQAGDPALAEPDNYLSFYSAHTSTAFAVSLAYAWTFALRHPHSPLRYVIFAAAGLTGAAIGTLRVLAGKHFPTDVLVGAVAGTVAGLAVPLLHRANVHASLAVIPLEGGAMVDFGVRF